MRCLRWASPVFRRPIRGWCRCADWILQKQVRKPGIGKSRIQKGEPGGWYFEFNNEFYPDVDDSAMVCLGLSRVEHPNGRYQSESVQRAIDWMLSMQCKNGGWASFDKDNDRMVFQYVPFADHNAMLDPATVDITGRILEMSGDVWIRSKPCGGGRRDQIYSQRAGTRRKLVWTLGRELHLWHDAGAARSGSHGRGSNDPMIQQAAEWLRSVQNADGGWGETVESYDDPNLRGQGESTASQTAWAIMGLLAVGDTRSECVARGMAYLLRTQNKDGSWDEAFFTGTGFPRVFYLKYHLYRQYFPLIALTTYSKVMAEKTAS